MQITSYESAATYLKGARNGTDRPLPGNGTRLARRGSAIAVSYRGTDVVTFHRNGTIAIDRGGWNSKTTADRIETYSPFRITAGRFDGSWSGKCIRRGPETWQVRHPNGTVAPIQDGWPVAV